ncbi:MAG TPA: MFS transporter [Mycobacteriales bacterium]|nr:MFS transporter [Mycobacteriales bacterium]
MSDRVLRSAPTVGLRANAAQFSLLVGINALVGGMLGQERTLLSLLATQEFHLTAYTAALTFIAAFGATKAVTNLFAGTWCDRYGRKPVLVVGWVVALPVPVLLMTASSWRWIVVANVLLGVSQGLTWSATIIMKIDLAGPRRRGLAMGLNEAAGYGAVALSALATGFIAARAGLRPEPFFLGLACAGLGLGLSTLVVRETRDLARLEAGGLEPAAVGAAPGAAIGMREPALATACQAGLVNNLNDGLAWGLFPLLFAQHGLSVARIGILAALYPGVWGVGQLATGWWSDRVGRKWLIAAGMWLQAVALVVIAWSTSFGPWAAAAVLLGVGTAMVYPTLLAVIADVAHPSRRARAVGVYRFWRDAGFVAGAVVAGVLADVYSVPAAIGVVAALTAASGGVVAVGMYESRPAQTTPLLGVTAPGSV